MLPLVKEAYKDFALSMAQAFRWFNELKNGQEDLERFGRASMGGRRCFSLRLTALNTYYDKE